MGMGDPAYVARFRDQIRRMIATELAKLQPPYRYGTVKSVNGTTSCQITFDGDTASVEVPLFGVVPTVGQRARVNGRTGDRYVEAVK